MPLLNYTTTVAVDKTVAEIQRILVAHGARSIRLDYEAGNPSALSFLIETRFGPRSVRLPANVEALWKVMTAQHKEGKIPRRFVSREQAARVAWRIVKDWLQAQLAIIETEMVGFDEVLLPYLLDERTGKTVYQVLSANRLALPPGTAAGE